MDAARPSSPAVVSDAAAEAWLGSEASRRVEAQVAAALRRARSSGKPVIVSVTGNALSDVDPTAAVVGSRRPEEPWFCFEQPDRSGTALAGLGCVRRLEASGDDRFVQVAARWRGLCASAVTDSAAGPPGSGLVAMGGFAFAAEGGAGTEWEGFAPASLVVP